MMSVQRFSVFLSVAVSGATLADSKDDAAAGLFPDRPAFPELNQFLGATNLPQPRWQTCGLGWARANFSWDKPLLGERRNTSRSV